MSAGWWWLGFSSISGAVLVLMACVAALVWGPALAGSWRRSRQPLDSIEVPMGTPVMPRLEYAAERWGQRGVELVLGDAPDGWEAHGRTPTGTTYRWGCGGCGAHGSGHVGASAAATAYLDHWLSECPYPNRRGLRAEIDEHNAGGSHE